jgi:hypothetical protein
MLAVVVDKRAADRELLQVWLTPTARQAIRDLCRSHRVTQTALFEALGELAAERDNGLIAKRVYDRAGEIDAERGSR